MKYIWANFVTTIKDWSAILIDNWKINWVCLDKIDSFKFSPYLSDLVLYSIQSKIEWKESIIFRNLYENDLLKITNKSREIIKEYFNIKWEYKSINFEEKNIEDYKNKHAYFHAYWAHMSSNFEDSVWLCIDYLGYNDEWNHQVQTIWNCKDNSINLIDNFDTTLTLNRWIGFTYSIFSDLFDIYKYDVPYLSIYWNKDRFKWILLYEYKNNNVYLRKEFLYWIELNSELLPKTFYASIEELGWNMNCIYSNIKNIFNISEKEIEESKKDLRKWIISDLLAYVEYETKKAIIYIAKKAYNIGESTNLTVSGWLASNHLLCRALIDETEFKDFYFEISPNYTGISIWGAFDLYEKKIYLEKTWYWKVYSDEMIKNDLEKYSDYLSFNLLENYDKQNEFLINKLEEKKIIWYFKWWSEIWPRALWNRSILAIWSCEDLGDRIRNIKNRQNWKPFSISVLDENISDYLNINKKSEFMSLSWKIKEEYKKSFVWINYDNDIIRYQSVWKNNNEYLNELLLKYKEKSGNGFLLNTSLNWFKQPIVESPVQSIELFLSSDIDYLILWNYIVSKEKIFEKFNFNYDELKKQKNINYFEVNRNSYNNYLKIKEILEKVVLANFKHKISEIKYFENTIDIEFKWNKLIIEKIEEWKKYDLKTSSIWIKIKKIENKKDLIIFYKKILMVDEKLKPFFQKWNFYLKDLINYL